MIGLIGRKVGMTRVFTEDGVSIPVTVIEIEANRVTQVKTLENDGYSAIQVTTGSKKASRVTKPEAGHFVKAGVELGSIGQNQTPGRVFKGKKMAGHLGAERVTVQSLEVVRVDAERKLLLVKGAVPGATNSDVIVKPAVKA